MFPASVGSAKFAETKTKTQPDWDPEKVGKNEETNGCCCGRTVCDGRLQR